MPIKKSRLAFYLCDLLISSEYLFVFNLSLNLDKFLIEMYFFSVSANEFVVIKKNAVSCITKSDIKIAFIIV